MNQFERPFRGSRFECLVDALMLLISLRIEVCISAASLTLGRVNLVADGLLRKGSA